LATVAAAGFLLEQAVIAVSKLDQLIAEKAVKDSDLEAFLENNPEARFFNNKRITAQNFVDTIVPEAEALLAGAKSRNYGALDINF
jgi:tRNA(Leu) C34 or U34 (ribose-2'-O)-methylase TrmL